MRKVLLGLVLLGLIFNLAYADESTKRNSYQITSFVNTSTQKTKAIDLPYTSADVTIINNDAADYVAVKVNGSTGTYPFVIETAGSFLLGPTQAINLYDYATDGITLIGYTAEASPVSVIVAY